MPKNLAFPTDPNYAFVTDDTGKVTDIRAPGGQASGLLAVDPVSGAANANGGVAFYPIQTFTWAAKPAAAGNDGRVIRISDYGNKPLLISDGTNWLPFGSTTWKSQAGTIATPISAFTGVTSSLFTIDQPVFPAGLLVPGRSVIEVDGVVRRTGANAAATLNVHFGTAKTSGDGAIFAFSLPATTLQDQTFSIRIAVQGVNAVSSTNWLARGGSGSTNVVKDQTANINTLADMGVSVSISGANAADSFALLHLTTRLLG